MKKRFQAKIYDAEEKQLKGTNISCNIIDDVKSPVWFVEFEKRNNVRWDRQKEFNQLVIERFDKQDKINEAIITRLGNIENDIVTIKHDIKRIDARIDNLVVKNNLQE